MHTYIHTAPYFMHPDTIKCEHCLNMMQTQTDTSGYYNMASILLQEWPFIPFFFPLAGWDFFPPFHFFSTILGFSFWHSYSFECEHPLHYHNQIRLECLKFSSSFLITDIFAKFSLLLLLGFFGLSTLLPIQELESLLNLSPSQITIILIYN